MAERTGGFTLIELLVVLLIMGLTLTMVSLSIDSGERERSLAHSAQLLARQAGTYLHEAEADGLGRGLALMGGAKGGWGWRWYRRHQGQWLPEKESLAGGTTGPLEMKLWVEGKAVELSARTVEPEQPDIVMQGSGELTPFALWLRDSASDAGTGLAVCADAIGRIVLQVDAMPVYPPCLPAES